MNDVLVVDKKGLARKLANRPKSFVIYELVQNGWDEPGVTEVTVKAEMLAGRPVCRIKVFDDAPDGFQELSSIYTLFKDSKKAPDPTKRGRFELGEKLVAAVALRMEVVTTKGGVLIEGDKRRSTRQKLQRGSAIEVDVRMTREEFTEVCDHVKRLIPPGDVKTTFNGETLPSRTPVCSFETTLQTIRTDEEGNLKPTQRKARVDVFEPLNGETPSIYEMGIPVVETGDRWHYDVQQRVPVNWERSNVPPSYLKTLRVEVLNAMAAELGGEDTKTVWVTQALEDERAEPEAVKTVIVTRFGDNAVAHDPSDQEGTKMSFAEGRPVVGGGTFSKGAWDNIRKAGALPPAGQVTPSPTPYGDGPPENVKDRKDWTDNMWRIGEFAEELCYRLTGNRCDVYIVTEITMPWAANFQKGGMLSGRRLCLNLGKLGNRWFGKLKRDERVLNLLLHEFAHDAVSDHLSHEYHREATRLGAKLANLCLDEPEFFDEPSSFSQA
jgi:hypothetical protein